MQIDATFFIIILGFIAAVIPLISEIFILPSKIKKYESKDITLFKQEFRNTVHIAFFYMVFISFLIGLINYFYPIAIEHIIEDSLIFALIIISLILGICRTEFDERTKGLIIELKRQYEFYFILMVFIFLIIISLINMAFIHNSQALFDKYFSPIIIISNLVLMGLYYKLHKNKF